MIDNLYDHVVELVLRKNSDYGDAWQSMGIITPAVRLLDKARRMATLDRVGSISEVAESLEDTLVDILGYSMLGILYKRSNDGGNHGVFGLPMVKVTRESLHALRGYIVGTQSSA